MQKHESERAEEKTALISGSISYYEQMGLNERI